MIHEPLTKPVTPGTTVLTPRGYGVVVDELRTYRRDHRGRFGYELDGLLIDLDDNAGRCVVKMRDLRVVETAEAQVA